MWLSNVYMQMNIFRGEVFRGENVGAEAQADTC